MHDERLLFDEAWYLDTNPDVAAAGLDPWWHYIHYGCAEGRKPNALFDPEWYLTQYPDVAAAGIDPVQHFITNGAAEGRDPSPEFQTRWYVQHYQDAAASAMNPLAHYLLVGRKEGRRTNDYQVDFSESKAVTATAIECRKKPVLVHREVALFVSHSPNGKLKPHVRHYLESLAREHIGIILVIAADMGFADDESWLYDLVDGLYVRANEGWDWACWAHLLRLNSNLYGADILYWLNDSVIGPVNQEAFHAVLERLRANPAALVGLTANHQFGWHLQSYFLAFKRQALESLAFKEFVLGVRCLPSRERVIHGYEIPFARRLDDAKVTAAALFAPNPTDNPTVHNWKQLLDEGFPFLKQVVAVSNDNTVVDNSGWRAALQRHGYDVTLTDRLGSCRDGKKLTASLGKGQIVEFIEDDEVETGEIVWRSRVFVENSLLFAPQRLTVLARNNALDELVATKLFYWLANNEIHVAGPAIVVRNWRLPLPYLKVGLRVELFAVPKRP